MSLLFLWLKATRQFETPEDWWRGLVLLGLDHLALIGWLRYVALRRR